MSCPALHYAMEADPSLAAGQGDGVVPDGRYILKMAELSRQPFPVPPSSSVHIQTLTLKQ